MHQQGCGKLRCIDSGKKPKHNEASLEAETIFTTSVDFIPAAVHAVLWYVLGTVQRLHYDDIDTLDDLCFRTVAWPTSSLAGFRTWHRGHEECL